MANPQAKRVLIRQRVRAAIAESLAETIADEMRNRIETAILSALADYDDKVAMAFKAEEAAQAEIKASRR